MRTQVIYGTITIPVEVSILPFTNGTNGLHVVVREKGRGHELRRENPTTDQLREALQAAGIDVDQDILATTILELEGRHELHDHQP